MINEFFNETKIQFLIFILPIKKVQNSSFIEKSEFAICLVKQFEIREQYEIGFE